MEIQKNWHQKHTEALSFGSRLADSVAKGMGSWRFIIIQTILVILWILGLVSSYTMGGFIHVLLVIAIIVIVLRLISGRKVI